MPPDPTDEVELTMVTMTFDALLGHRQPSCSNVRRQVLRNCPGVRTYDTDLVKPANPQAGCPGQKCASGEPKEGWRWQGTSTTTSS